MQCDYFDGGRCRSCALMGTPYATQLADKVAHCRDLLPRVSPGVWLEAFSGPEQAFRNKAKLVVGGRRGAPTLGILDASRRGVDLRHCGLYEPLLSEAVQRLPDVVAALGLTPYDVSSRSGELKHLLVTHSPDDELMLRFVLRSPGQLVRLREGLPRLAEALSGVRVVTANLQPEHKAVLEGPVEEVLTEADTLPMRVNDVPLLLGPRSFFQTNTIVAAALYRQVRAWVADIRPGVLWDLYCGVGGFALHALGHGAATVVGVETSPDAVAAARTSAVGLSGEHRWYAADATAFAQDPPDGAPCPDLVVVNPPRRGVGPALAAWLDEHGPRHVVYSSCNATTLARDLDAMPSYRPAAARLFDMFPQTRHHEVVLLLERARFTSAG